MQTTVNLQPLFSYSIYYIIFIVLLIVILTIITIYLFVKKKVNKVVEEEAQNILDKKINLDDIKQKYLQQLDLLKDKLKNKKISIRGAYQNLSSIIRHFVYEVTNIKVQNYTLKEIKKLNMPILYELIKEYYAPEFARRSLGNIMTSIEKARRVIEKWN